MKISRTWLLAIELTALWVVLSAHFTLFFAVCAVSSISITLWLTKKMDIAQGDITLSSTVFGVVIYSIWLLKEMLLSSVAVTKTIWQAKMPYSPQLSWIRSKHSDDAILATYANSITLTPGTVTINVEGSMLEVHSLYKDDMKSLRQGHMENRISQWLMASS